MTTPPAPPPGSDPYGWPPPNTPPGGSSTPGGQQDYPAPQYGQSGQPGYPGDYGQTSAYPTQPGYDPSAGYGAPAYAGYGNQPGYYQDAAAPYGYDQHGRPYSDKQKLIAGLLQILVGGFGVGRFYTGHIGIGIAQIVVTLVTCGVGALWGLIDGILILVNGGTDAQGRPLRND